MNKFGIAIHGGAGTIKKSTMTSFDEEKYLAALDESASEAYSILQNGGSAIDAVELAVEILEDCPLFNAGKGSVYTHDGGHEMDASIMCGQTLNAGAIAAVKGIRNPVRLARKVMDGSDYVFLCGEGAAKFGEEHNLSFEDDAYFHTENRYNQWQAVKDGTKAILDHDGGKKFGTVGAVAVDRNGNVAAATSTGGLTNKQFGRLGDSAVIGSGNYADNNTCAISCTGYGEYFIRAVVGYDVACLMKYKSLSLHHACQEVLSKLTAIGGEGGFVAVDQQGNMELIFNTEGMYRAFASSGMNGRVQADIYKS